MPKHSQVLEIGGQGEGVPEAAVPGPSRPLEIVLEPNLLRPENKDLFTRGIRKRRSAPIHGYVGLNGNFKTCAMVRDTLPSLAVGRRVLSTVAILDPHTGNAHPQYTPFRSWSQLHDLKNTDVLLDEITGIMDARDQGMPKHVRRMLPQMRRANVMIRWTGIDWDNSDKRLRQLTQAATKCKGHFPDFRSIKSGTVDTLSMWAPNRLAFLTTYDAQTLQSTEDSAQLIQQDPGQKTRKARARVLTRELFWGPGSLAFECYDTYAPVLAVDAGCVVCGGKVPEKTCRDESHREAVASL